MVSLCLTDMMYGNKCSSFFNIRNTLEEDNPNSCDRQRWVFLTVGGISYLVNVGLVLSDACWPSTVPLVVFER